MIETTTLPAPGSVGAWILASRPPTLAAAVAPVAVGAAVASVAGELLPLPTLACLAVAILIQIGTNFANDVFDYERGADTEARLGPTRAVQAGLLSPSAVRWGMIATFGLAFAFGLWLTWVAGWPLLVLWILSILSGIAYTGGPYPLGYNGLGDVFVLLFFGFAAVCGTVYVNLGAVPELAWWASIPPGALATGILVVNNLRDLPTDREAGKRTLAVRWGRRGAELEYAVLLVASYAVPVVIWARGLVGPLALLPWLSLPPALAAYRDVRRLEGRPLNRTLAATARLLVVFSALFAVGLVFAA